MPYRINPNNAKQVQVQKNGRWQTAPGGNQQSHEAALKYLHALQYKVEHAYRAKKGGKHK